MFVLKQTFQGNRDQLSVQTHPINPAIYGRYVRIIPRGWKSHISIRLELYGSPWSKFFKNAIFVFVISVVWSKPIITYKLQGEVVVSLTLYSLTSVSIFSLLFSIHSLGIDTENSFHNQASNVGDHFLNSHDLN